jgi:DNA-binding IclR family transcriptional regulator
MAQANPVLQPADTGPKPRALPRRVKAVDHAIDVLECIAGSGRAMGVSDIARATSLSKATVHHLLATLVARRLVMQEPHSTQYRLGWNLYELGSSVVRHVDLSRVARPFLDQLAAQTNDTVLLGILEENSVLYLDRGEAPTVLRTIAAAGRRSPLHATASGKVLLAFADPRLVNRVLRKGLPQLTPSTVTNTAALRDQLAEVRTRGYAVCWEERELGLSSVAVPLRNYTGAVVACLTLAATSARLSEDSLNEHLRPLARTATQIERHLGAAQSDEPVDDAY